jgi:hypothetical protein
MDIRIQQLSYSSLLTLHSCPRKFQLYRLGADRPVTDQKSQVTFSLGHIVGAGVQWLLEGKSIDDFYWEAFQIWDTDLFAEDTKARKSFWESMTAVERFAYVRDSSLLKDYELVYYTPEGKTEPVPAVELSFIISLPNGFKYRGFVDAVLRHRVTGAILVLEVKSTGLSAVQPATYKNSAQAIGYSIVLDVLFPELSAYEVLYLVYQTKSREYTPLPFKKSYLQRALWIQELLLDCDTILMYEKAGVYPMHGESCFNYFRECDYLNTCTLSTSLLTVPCTQEQEEKVIEQHDTFHISLDVEDLIAAQIAKSLV